MATESKPNLGVLNWKKKRGNKKSMALMNRIKPSKPVKPVNVFPNLPNKHTYEAKQKLVIHIDK